jgi:hypothetical protein
MNYVTQDYYLTKYLHKACFGPTTEDAINKHLKMTPVTAMVDTNERRQNIQSFNKVRQEIWIRKMK